MIYDYFIKRERDFTSWYCTEIILEGGKTEKYSLKPNGRINIINRKICSINGNGCDCSIRLLFDTSSLLIFFAILILEFPPKSLNWGF